MTAELADILSISCFVVFAFHTRHEYFPTNLYVAYIIRLLILLIPKFMGIYLILLHEML